VKEERQERGRRFNALFNAYGADIVAYCTWRAGSTSDAEEAVADVFLTAWPGRRASRGRRAGLAVRDCAKGAREPTPVHAPPHRRSPSGDLSARPDSGTGRAEAAGNTGQPGEGRASSASVTRLSAAL